MSTKNIIQTVESPEVNLLNSGEQLPQIAAGALPVSVILGSDK